MPHCVAYLDAAQEFLDRGRLFEQVEGQGFETLRKLVVPGERVPGGLPSSLLRCCPALDTLVIEHFDDDSDLTAVGELGNLKRLELKFRGTYARPLICSWGTWASWLASRNSMAAPSLESICWPRWNDIFPSFDPSFAGRIS